jgi:hypothetical protein
MSDFVSLADINEELERLAAAANSGVQIDENRFDKLISMRLNNAEFQEQERLEHVEWMEEWRDFLEQAVVEMRGYVPHTIFETSQSDLQKSLPPELVKRLFQKQCVWLVRMTQLDVSRLHESMLFGRYNPEGHDLDVVELGAIYFSLPDAFSSDHPHYRKVAWKERIELRLKTALKNVNMESMETFSKSRKSLYLAIPPPFDDVETMHAPQITRNVVQRKKSFEEVCRRHSILRKPSIDQAPVQEGDSEGSDQPPRSRSSSSPAAGSATSALARTTSRANSLVQVEKIEEEVAEDIAVEAPTTRSMGDKKQRKSSGRIRTADI